MRPPNKTNRKERRGFAFMLALGMHVVLALFLLISVHWQTHHQPIQVELWSAPPPLQSKKIPTEKQQPQIEKHPIDPVVEKTLTKEPDIEEKAKIKEKEKPKTPPRTASLPEKRRLPTETVAQSMPQMTPKPIPKLEPELEKGSEMATILSQGLKNLNRSDIGTASKNQLDGKGRNPNAVAGAGPGTGTGDSLIGSYQSMLANLIRSRNNYPDDKPGNPQAQFKLVIWPDGRIQKIVLMSQQGDLAYAQASERAILSLGQLPSPPPGIHFNQLNGMIITCKLRE